MSYGDCPTCILNCSAVVYSEDQVHIFNLKVFELFFLEQTSARG